MAHSILLRHSAVASVQTTNRDYNIASHVMVSDVAFEEAWGMLRYPVMYSQLTV